jgi:hypothetical protein
VPGTPSSSVEEDHRSTVFDGSAGLDKFSKGQIIQPADQTVNNIDIPGILFYSKVAARNLTRFLVT